MTKMIILDGNSLLFRAFYATYSPDKSKLMRAKNGTPTNALFAFSNMIASIISSLKKGDAIFVAFDAGKHTFRHKEYAEYKANRPPCPEDLLQQMPIVREFLTKMNITYYEDENIEADDIAGNIAKKAELNGYQVEIYTSDKDYLQLIDENITIKLIKKGLKDIHVMNVESFKNEWGFMPEQILDYKGLMGDPSDNLKGIPKIGDKTAKKLISEYGSLENIISAAPSFNNKVGENIINYQNDGKMCKHLAKIRTDDSLPLDLKDMVYEGYNLNKILEFCRVFDLKTLINRLPVTFRKSEINDVVTYENIDENTKFDTPEKIGIGLDLSEGNYHDATLYGVSLCINGKNYYIDVSSLKRNQNILDIIKNSSVKKKCFDYKQIKYVLNSNGIEINGLSFDLLLASYLLNPSGGTTIDSVVSNEGIDISYSFKNTNLLFETTNPLLSAIKAYYPYIFEEKYKKDLKDKNQYNLLIEIEQPLTIVLCEMEYEGFPINKQYLISLGEGYKQKLEQLSKEIYLLAGEEFNIASPKQVSYIIYDKLGLKGNKHNSTSIEYLKYLVDEHPIVAKIIEHRKYSKLLSTYVDGILPFIKEDNKIHATFNQDRTSTGRLSSSEPNLQNITVRDEESKMIRKAFYYDNPHLYILSLDYSQIELRILAHLSNSETLINVFNNGEDIHAATARKVFNVEGELDPSLRRKAKAINFGIIYGISDWGLSEQLEISVAESKEIISSFYKNFPEIKEYLSSLTEIASQKGYAETMFNRRRYLPEINSNQYQLREFAKRAAMNAPIQGSAADLIKIAMINVDKALKNNNFKSRIVSQIHDEIIVKLYDDEIERVVPLVKNIMENCVNLKTKLVVEGGYASSWFDAK